ncbi:MAG: hypothetical protein ACOH2J_21380 [Allorhizobium sp.]
MGTSWTRVTLLFVTMTFFTALAMDIAVPALVLSAMALSITLTQSGFPTRRWKERTA